MPLHSMLGFAVVGLAVLGFLLALDALWSRSRAASVLMFVSFILCLIVQLPALVTGVVDNAAGQAASLAVAPLTFFVAGACFTLNAALVAWRTVNPGVLWDAGKWLAYQAMALGLVGLGVGLVYLGRQALGAG